MTLLTLITHAHTQRDPALDAVHWRLSAAGEQQAAVLAGQPFWRDVDRILVSSEPKTRLTVAPLLAVYDLPLLSDSRFDEARRPGWVENYAAQVAHFFADPLHSVDGWEPAADALNRILDAFATHIQPDGEGHVALVGHGLVLSLYRAHVLGLPRPPFDAWLRLGFAAVARVDLCRPTLLQDFTPVAPSPPRGQ